MCHDQDHASRRALGTRRHHIPFGVRLTGYGGEASDLPPDVFNRQLRAIAEGRLKVRVARVFHGLEQVRDAQVCLEGGTTTGKRVVVLD